MKDWLSILALTVVGLAVCLVLERRQVSALRAQNQVLASQTEQVSGLIAENARLAKMLSELKRDPAPADSNFRELMKLRGDVGYLRQEVSRLEAKAERTGNSNLREQDPEVSLALGRSKLRYAEEMLIEAEKKFAVGVTTQSELDRARFEHDIVQAELQGDSGRVRQLKAEMAEKNFVMAEAKAQVGVISSEELERMRFERDLAVAEIIGNALEVSRIKLEGAEAQLKAWKARRDVGVISARELLQIELARDVAAAEYASALKQGK